MIINIKEVNCVNKYSLNDNSIYLKYNKIRSCQPIKRKIFTTRSVNARFTHRIVGQSNFTCPFQIDQSQSFEVTISSPSHFYIGKNFMLVYSFLYNSTIIIVYVLFK